MNPQTGQGDGGRIESCLKLIEEEPGLEVAVGEPEPEDLGLAFVELEPIFGLFSGFGFWVGAGPAYRGPGAVACGADVIWVDVGVEALEEEDGDLEERE